MSAESNARSHAEEFHWWRGSPELDAEVAELRDLVALRNATEELIALQVHEVIDSAEMPWRGVASEVGLSLPATRIRYGRHG